MTSLAMYKQVLSPDWFYRWLVIAATALVAGIGLFVMRVSISGNFLRQASIIMLLPLAVGLVFNMLAWRIKPLTFVLSACADFFLSIGQLLAFSLVGIVFTYVAATANLPLMDDVFAHVDAAMGFRWEAANAWFLQHPALHRILWIAYLSIGVQLITLFFIHSTREPREGSGELIWIYMVSLLIVTVISVFLPAAAMSGMIGQRHIDVFLALRNGSLTVLDDSTITGLVAFPSFHAALGVLCIYSARTMKWPLAVFAPLNVLMIVATVPCGGHYLVDTIAGLAVAAVAILVVRKIRPAIATRVSSAAPRGAAFTAR
jgi:membrane-associated phospholipid phosphatase